MTNQTNLYVSLTFQSQHNNCIITVLANELPTLKQISLLEILK